MKTHTRRHNLGHALAAAALLVNAGCASGSSSSLLPPGSSAQQLSPTHARPLTQHLHLAMLFSDSSTFVVYPTQDNAGQCWEPATLEKPMGPGNEQSFVLDYDFRCGDTPPAFTVLWRTNPANLGLGCKFSFEVQTTTAEVPSYKITTTNGDLTCTAKMQTDKGGVLMQYGFIAN